MFDQMFKLHEVKILPISGFCKGMELAGEGVITMELPYLIFKLLFISWFNDTLNSAKLPSHTILLQLIYTLV